MKFKVLRALMKSTDARGLNAEDVRWRMYHRTL